jgi:hypothetical protein
MHNSQWFCYIFALLFLPMVVSAQSKYSPAQMQAMLQATGQDSNRVKMLLELGSYHLSKPEELKHDLDSALYFLLAANALCNHLKDEKWTNETLWLLGRCYFERGEI